MPADGQGRRGQGDREPGLAQGQAGGPPGDGRNEAGALGKTIQLISRKILLDFLLKLL